MPSILITGGTRGIGLALSKAFACKGWKVASCYHLDEESAQKARTEMSRLTPDYLLEKCDVTVEKTVSKMVKELADQWDGLDCVIHNAGATSNARILNTEETQWEDTLAVHLKGAFLISKAALRSMLRRRSGHLIFISSIVGTTGNIGQGAYTAAKAGLVGFSRSLAQEYGSKNIRSNVVCPGFHKTGLSSGLTPQAEETIRKNHLLDKTANLDEVADFMVWLAGATSISGQVFNLDSRIPGWL